MKIPFTLNINKAVDYKAALSLTATDVLNPLRISQN